jgi:hypothetical protein
MSYRRHELLQLLDQLQQSLVKLDEAVEQQTQSQSTASFTVWIC